VGAAEPGRHETLRRKLPVCAGPTDLLQTGRNMTLTEAYEALLKMPVRNPIRVFDEGGRTKKKDSTRTDSGSRRRDDMPPAKWHDFMKVIAGDA